MSDRTRRAAEEQRKKLFSSGVRDILNDDISNITGRVGKDIITKGIKPTIQGALYDIGKELLRRFLYPEGEVDDLGVPTQGGGVSYDKMHRSSGEKRNDIIDQTTMQKAPTSKSNDIFRARPRSKVYPTRAMAEDALNQMYAVIKKDGYITLPFFIENMSTLETEYTHNNFGWTDITGAEIKGITGGYVVYMPKPEQI